MHNRCCRGPRLRSGRSQIQGLPRSPECGSWSRGHRANGPERCDESPLSSGCVLVRPDNGGIDHLQGVGPGPALGQGLQKHIPEPRACPPEELAVDRRPLACLLRQIAPGRTRPRDPEDGIEHAAMVSRRSSPLRPSLNYERLKEGPFRVAQSASNQSCRPPNDSLESLRASADHHFVNKP